LDRVTALNIRLPDAVEGLRSGRGFAMKKLIAILLTVGFSRPRWPRRRAGAAATPATGGITATADTAWEDSSRDWWEGHPGTVLSNAYPLRSTYRRPRTTRPLNRSGCPVAT